MYVDTSWILNHELLYVAVVSCGIFTTVYVFNNKPSDVNISYTEVLNL